MQSPTRRLTLIANTVSVLRALRSEMPAHTDLIDTTILGLSKISERYEQRANDLNMLANALRKPPLKRGRVAKPRLTSAADVALIKRAEEFVVTKRRCSCGPHDTCALCRTEPPMDNSNLLEENPG